MLSHTFECLSVSDVYMDSIQHHTAAIHMIDKVFKEPPTNMGYLPHTCTHTHTYANTHIHM